MPPRKKHDKGATPKGNKDEITEDQLEGVVGGAGVVYVNRNRQKELLTLEGKDAGGNVKAETVGSSSSK